MYKDDEDWKEYVAIDSLVDTEDDGSAVKYQQSKLTIWTIDAQIVTDTVAFSPASRNG